MAKRRKPIAPSAEELSALEQGFAAKPSTPAPGMMPPIAKVAAETAALTPVGDPAQRAKAAADTADAERFREAEAEGRVIRPLPLSQIIADELTRDRLDLGTEAMEELKASIRLGGLRLPVEVFPLSEPDPSGAQYGLVSGYRRLAAFRALASENPQGGYDTIPALIREPGSVGAAYRQMVEENEIRADLTPYERGRIAVIAAGQGAFDSVEAAVNGLFHAASKAKRSKIRGFAVIHEELGDMLEFPEQLSERAGLRLAACLRAGYASKLREALATGQGIDPESEWQVLEPIVDAAEAETRDPKRAGRPRKSSPKARPQDTAETRHLENGITLRRLSDAKGHYLRIEGRQVDSEYMRTVLDELARLLGPA
ncbi:MAG: ParB/RepB/Spo0J family partition protein [Mangrovicoccus sp.]